MVLRVLLSAPCPAARARLTALLQREHFEVIEGLPDGVEVVRLAQTLRPDVVILGEELSRQTGTAAAAAIHEALPGTPLILLMPPGTEAQIRRALSAGVSGCVFETEPAEDVVRAVYEVSRGAGFLSLGALRVLFEPYLRSAGPDRGS